MQVFPALDYDSRTLLYCKACALVQPEAGEPVKPKKRGPLKQLIETPILASQGSSTITKTKLALHQRWTFYIVRYALCSGSVEYFAAKGSRQSAFNEVCWRYTTGVA